jgi:hypothetical protein
MWFCELYSLTLLLVGNLNRRFLVFHPPFHFSFFQWPMIDNVSPLENHCTSCFVIYPWSSKYQDEGTAGGCYGHYVWGRRRCNVAVQMKYATAAPYRSRIEYQYTKLTRHKRNLFQPINCSNNESHHLLVLQWVLLVTYPICTRRSVNILQHFLYTLRGRRHCCGTPHNGEMNVSAGAGGVAQSNSNEYIVQSIIRSINCSRQGLGGLAN